MTLGFIAQVNPSPAESLRSFDRGFFTHLDGADGLPNLVVRQVLQDHQGFLWFGTQNGLARYDGFHFETFAHQADDPSSLSGGFILSLREDAQGRLWIGTQGSGLNRFDPSTRAFVHYRHDPADVSSLAHDSVRVIHEGTAGELWIGTGHGLSRLIPGTGTFEHFRHPSDDPSSPLYNQIKALWQDHLGVLWVGTQGGLARLDPQEGQIARLDTPGAELGQILSLLEDDRGKVWIGAENGFFYWDRQAEEIVTVTPEIEEVIGRSTVEVIALYQDPAGVLWLSTGRDVIAMDVESHTVVAWHRAGEAASRLGDYVWEIAGDRSGGLWFGTRSGVSYRAPRHQVFTHYRPTDGSQRLGNIASIREAHSGDVWVGTWGQGLHRFDRRASRIRHYRHDPTDPTSLSNDWVWTIFEDSSRNLWVGTNLGLDRWDPLRDEFVRFQPSPGGPTSFGPGGVGGIVEDLNGDLWVAKSSYLTRVDARNGRLTQYAPDPADPERLGGHDLLALHLDRQGELWICSDGDGLLRFDRERQIFHRFRHDPEEASSLSNNQVSSIYEDVAGTLWIGTLGGGLSWLEPKRDGFQHLRQRDGLPSDWITGVQGDDRDRLWLGTDKGLARFDPRTGEVRVYDAKDGALDGFSARAHASSSSGALFFGGSQDLIAFLPDDIRPVDQASPVFITGLQTFGSRSADKGRRPDLLPAPVRDRDASITLAPEDHLFAIEFAALEYANPEKVRFVYQLEGFDSGWIPTDASLPLAQYSGVPPGTYNFRVRAANRDGVWDEEGASLAVTVQPAFWQTWWAYALYSLAVIAIVGVLIRSQLNKLAYERAASARLLHLDKLKDEFLANTSHELRTPLFGMTGLAESLIDGAHGPLPQAVRTDLSMLVSSGRRLSALVDDILALSSLRERSLDLQRRPVDLRALTDVVLELSRPLTRSKGLKLINRIPADLPAADADENRLQQILYNLVGNAIKFSETGNIEVDAGIEAGRLAVKVVDSGIGIPEELQGRIFEAFEQADASTQRRFGGTGLGLAIARQLVELHGGTLEVESTAGEGSTFLFTLAIADGEAPRVSRASQRILERSVEVADELQTTGPPLDLPGKLESSTSGPSRTVAPPKRRLAEVSQRILVVDDEPVNRQVLMNHLKARKFQVTQASNGPQALQWLRRQTFDLVLLDVMMPKMSGYEVCRQLREQFSIQQLPVIFLTAKHQAADLVTGLEVGGNDYLTKPVPKDELLARVQTHLDLLSVHRHLEHVIGERGRFIAEREHLIDELKTRNAALANFNHVVAHDLRNPLTTIRTYIDLVQQAAKQGNTELLEQDLKRVDAAADRLHRQLEDLFAISRTGDSTGAIERVPLDELAREARHQLLGSAIERGATVKIGSRLPAVQGDRAQLLEVFWHLLANALKFLGDQPAPHIEIGAHRQGEEEIIYVRDNGIGIAPRYHDKIFEVFEQLKAGDEGTGAGLALVKQILEVHGGRVWVESEGAGHGSTFYLALPAVVETSTQDETLRSA